MRIGVAFWLNDAAWDQIEAWARAASTANVDSLWVDDHLLSDEGDPSAPRLEAWSTLAALAERVDRAELGVLVSSVSFRNAFLIAKLAVTLDHLSNGRAVLGLGAGWFSAEHEAAGIGLSEQAGDRFDRLREAVVALRQLLDGESVTLEGRYVRLQNAVARPRAKRAHIPILLGGSGQSQTLPLVAMVADRWNSFGSPTAFAEASKVLALECNRIGRPDDSIRRSVNLNVVIRDQIPAAQQRWADYVRRYAPRPGPGRDPILGPPRVVSDVIKAYEAAGADEVVISFRSPWDVETMERIEDVRANLE